MGNGERVGGEFEESRKGGKKPQKLWRFSNGQRASMKVENEVRGNGGEFDGVLKWLLSCFSVILQTSRDKNLEKVFLSHQQLLDCFIFFCVLARTFLCASCNSQMSSTSSHSKILSKQASPPKIPSKTISCTYHTATELPLITKLKLLRQIKTSFFFAHSPLHAATHFQSIFIFPFEVFLQPKPLNLIRP
jgi:hypothetical protein